MVLESDPPSADEVPAEHAAIIDRLLAAYDIARTAPPLRVPNSILNDNYRLETTGGTRFVRIHKRGRTRDRIEREHTVLDWCAERGLAAAPPLKAVNGESIHQLGGRFLAVFVWLDGRLALRGAITAAESATLGDALGRVHATLREFDAVPLPTGTAGTSWDTQLSIQAIDRVDDLIRYYPAPTEAQLRVQAAMREQLAVLESDTPRPASDFAALTVQPVHGDFHERNVILAADGALRAVVDWEMVARLPAAYEVLRAATFMKILDEALLLPFLDAYGAHARLPREECELAVEQWYQSRIHETWAYSERYIQGNRRVEPLLLEPAEHVRVFGNADFRAKIARTLREHAG